MGRIGAKVGKQFRAVYQTRERPEAIRMDNSSELCSKAMGTWAYNNKAGLDFIHQAITAILRALKDASETHAAMCILEEHIKSLKYGAMTIIILVRKPTNRNPKSIAQALQSMGQVIGRRILVSIVLFLGVRPGVAKSCSHYETVDYTRRFGHFTSIYSNYI